MLIGLNPFTASGPYISLISYSIHAIAIPRFLFSMDDVLLALATSISYPCHFIHRWS
jgi:hypothetical protein